MAAEFYAVVTDMGTKKMLEAMSDDRKVNITEFAAGDGGGETHRPTADMTELRNEVWRGKINSCKIHPESENILVIEAVIPSDEGGFTIREMGVFDEEGTMIAVCNTPDTQKVRVTDGVVHELALSMEIALSNTESVELKIDPGVIMATKKDIERLKIIMEDHFEECAQRHEAVSGFAAANREMISALQDKTADAEERLSLIELMYATEIKKNPFSVTFADFTDLIVEGIWNVPLKRVEF